MTITHLDTGRELRGGQRQLLLLAKGLAERGHYQRIACPEGSELCARARAEGFSVLALESNPGGFASLGKLRRAITADTRDRSGANAERTPIIHAHDGRGQTIGALSSLGLTVRRVATRRVTFMPEGLGRVLRIHLLQYGPTCDAIVAVSSYIREVLVQSGLDASKIEVIPDGITIPPELPGPELRARARCEFGMSPQAFVIGHAGALTHEKGQDVLLAAFLDFVHARPEARLLLAGDGRERDSHAIAARLKASEGRARLLAPIDDLAPFFAALDLYVMPSRAEGLGSSALLAMAHGVPVVASRVGGLTEVVDEGRTGWLVAPDSARSLEQALEVAASDPERLRRYGLAGRERARSYASKLMIDRTEALYRRLLAAKP